MESALIFTGIGVSLLVEFIKTKFNLSTTGNLALVAALSLVGAVAYFFFDKYGLMESVLQILATAGAFYAFIIRPVQKLY